MGLIGKKEQTYYTGIPKPGIVLCLITAGVIMSALVVSSCSREGRHKALTFFFEGVPDLDGPGQGRLRITRTTNVDLLSSATLRRKMGGVLSQKAGSIHAAARDCNACHAGTMNQRQRELIKPLPELCYSCHKNYETAGVYLHGPIAVGACVFCHDPHQSAYIYLQRARLPDLCYRCHTRQDIATIAGHADNPDVICTKCHDPHVSSMKKLLKPAAKLMADPNSVDSVEMPKEDPNTVNLSK